MLFLQELGACPGATSEVTSQEFMLGGRAYSLFLVSAPEAHRCQATLIRADLGFSAERRTALPTGMLLQGSLAGNSSICFACLHLPHSKGTNTDSRPHSGAEECWKNTLEQLDAGLESRKEGDSLVMGLDLNQDIHAKTDSFAGMTYLRGLMAKYSLSVHVSVGSTWGARGVESEIDAVLASMPRTRMYAWNRDDMKEALPSDHSPVFCRLVSPQPLVHRGRRLETRCGRWITDSAVIEEYANQGGEFNMKEFEMACTKARRMPSLRYRDSESLKSMIKARREETDPGVRAAQLCQIRHQRALDKTEHKLSILERARLGDRQAISFLRS